MKKRSLSIFLLSLTVIFNLAFTGIAAAEQASNKGNHQESDKGNHQDVNEVDAIAQKGSQPGTTQLIVDLEKKNSKLAIKVSNMVVKSPKQGSAAPSDLKAYISGSDISGVDARINKYVAIYEINRGNRVIGFKMITLTSAMIQPVPAPLLNATAQAGGVIGSTNVTAAPAGGNYLVVQISALSIAKPNVGDNLPNGTGITNPYVSGTDIVNINLDTDKYLAIYEADSFNTIVTFKLITLTKEMIKQDPWSLVWSDEFNGNVIDRTKWTFETGNGVGGWGNNEKEFYTDRPENAKLSNGALVITAQKENYQGQGYTSARMKTSGLFSKKYGKFEMKAKLPAGKGYWPAFWLLPETNEYGAWAASGEIDIMESAGSRPNEVSGTIHYGADWPNNKYTGKPFQFASGTTIEDTHTYAVEWEPGEIRWYVDGQLYQTQNNWHSIGANQAANFAYPAPFDKEFFLLLNLAVGGNFDGDPDATTSFPKTMEVDYVRVYELTGRPYKEALPPIITPEPYPANAKLPLADGNLVYNNNFDQEVAGVNGIEGLANTDYWSFLHVADFGGAGSVSIDPIGNRNFAKVDITQAGNQAYSLQLIPEVTVGKGRYYKASFDAKSTGSRTINSKIGGGPSRGYVVYSSSESFALTNDLKHYEMSFQMSQETDVAARFEFNLGLNTQSVWIGNVRLEEIAKPLIDENTAKPPLGDGNHIYNGTFDQGNVTRLMFWNFAVNGATAAASVAEAARELKVGITNGGVSANTIELTQKGINLLNDNEYKLSFQARAASARTIEIDFRSKDGTLSYSKQTVDLSTAMETKSLNFHMAAASDIEGQLVFQLGGNNNDVYLDNIRLTRTSEYIDPNVILFPLKNGDFSTGMAPWTNYIHFDAAANVSVENGQMKVAITNEGNETYSVMPMQTKLAFSKGIDYVLEFDASSSVNRQLQVVLENASYARAFEQIVSLTPTTTRYKFTFKVTNDDVNDLKFLLGKIQGASPIGTHDVLLDNIVLEVKSAKQYASILKNGTFKDGLNNWGSYFADFDGASGNVSVNNGELLVGINYEGPQFWSVQATQGNFTLNNAKTYQLTFDARATINRDIQAIIEHNGDSFTKYLQQTVSLTGQMKTYSYKFTSTAVDAAAHLTFALGNISGAIGAPHDVFIDNVSLIEVESPPAPPVGHELLNGSFDTNTDHWQLYKADGSDAETSVVDGTLNISFTNYDGWSPWSTQVYQDQLMLEAGKTYVVSFDASATAAKSILFTVEKTADFNIKYLDTQTIDITSSTQTYTYEFTVSGATEDNAKLLFQLGSNNAQGPNYAGQKVNLDNISLHLK